MFGFFGFITTLFLWCVVLQWTARLIFAYHLGAAVNLSIVQLLASFRHGFILDLAWAGYCLLALSFFLFLYYQFKNRLFLFLLRLVAVVVVFSSLFSSFVDSELFSRWGVRFNSQALQYLYSPNEAMASSSEASWVRISIIMLLLLVVFVVTFNKMVRKYNPHNSAQRDWLKPSVSFLIFCSLSFIAARGGLGTIPISQSSVVFSSNSLQNTLAVNSAWNFCYYLLNKSDVPKPADFKPEKLAVENSYSAYSALFTADTPLTLQKRPNVCIIMLESFTAEASAFLGGKFNAMPFLDSLSSQGLAFSHAYSQGDRTDKGLACVVSGWPGQPWQSILHEPDKAAKLPSLPNLFSKAGYPTSFVYGGDLSFANMKSYLAAAGFQTIIDENDYNSNQITSKWGAHDEHAFSKLIQLNEKAKQPFFHVLLTLSSHEPFDVPGPKYFSGTDVNSKFLNSIRYTDDCIKKFIQSAQKHDWFNNTVFVFVADHGRDVGLPETAFNRPGNFRVPLLFWGPALNPALTGKKVNRIAAQTDIAQTLCCEVLSEKQHIFPYSRNLLSSHSPNMALFLFNGGVGLVSDAGAVVFENREKSVYSTATNELQKTILLQQARDLQYKLVSDYWNF